MREIIVSFYAPEDNYERMREVSFVPTATTKEIADNLEWSYGGKCQIVGYVYID